MNIGLTSKEYFVKDLVIDDEYGVIESTATIQAAAKKMTSGPNASCVMIPLLRTGPFPEPVEATEPPR